MTESGYDGVERIIRAYKELENDRFTERVKKVIGPLLNLA